MTTEAQVQGLGEFGRLGFTLHYLDDQLIGLDHPAHIWELRHEGKNVTYIEGGNLPTNVPEEYVQELCARHLVIKHGWNGCIWSRQNEEENQAQKKKQE